MRIDRFVFFCIVFLTLVSCEKHKTIVILHDNDVHCAIEGYLPFAGYKRAILDADTAYVVTVSSGDFVQGGSVGSVSRGAYVIDMMNAVDYDVVTLGNHEFDYGGNRLKELMGNLHGDVVNANFTLYNSMEPVYSPYVIKQYGERKIAFIGATTPGAIYSEAYTFFDKQGNQVFDLHAKEVVNMIQRAADEARNSGADYVILLSHLGEVPVLSKVCSMDLIAQTHGIDAVLEGHTHNVIPEQWVPDAYGHPVLLTQTGTRFTHIGQLTIAPDGSLHSECIPVESVADYHDAHADSVYQSINAQISDLMERPLSHSNFVLNANDDKGRRVIRCSETNLGDFIADAMRTITGTQIALMNGGGVRIDIPKGEVKYKQINDVLPFSNKIVTLEMTGQQVLDLLEWTTTELPQMSGSFLQVSGMRYSVDTRLNNTLSVNDQNVLEVKGSRRVKDVEIERGEGAWEALHADSLYTVATIDFVSNTSRTFPTLIPVKHIQDDLFGDIQCLIQYLEMCEGEIPVEYQKPKGRINIIL